MESGDIVAIATGTTGLTAFLIYVVRALWIEHQKDDDDVRKVRDELAAALKEQAGASKEAAAGIVELGVAMQKLSVLVARLVAKKP